MLIQLLNSSDSWHWVKAYGRLLTKWTTMVSLLLNDRISTPFIQFFLRRYFLYPTFWSQNSSDPWWNTWSTNLWLPDCRSMIWSEAWSTVTVLSVERIGLDPATDGCFFADLTGLTAFFIKLVRLPPGFIIRDTCVRGTGFGLADWGRLTLWNTVLFGLPWSIARLEITMGWFLVWLPKTDAIGDAWIDPMASEKWLAGGVLSEVSRVFMILNWVFPRLSISLLTTGVPRPDGPNELLPENWFVISITRLNMLDGAL